MRAICFIYDTKTYSPAKLLFFLHISNRKAEKNVHNVVWKEKCIEK